MHACKTVLMNGENTWAKKKGDDLFDVPMGSFHGAEVCELVGLFLLDKLKDVIDRKCVGLYRDDGLGVIPRMSNKNLDGLRKKIHNIFKEEGFSITLEFGIVKTEFLDVQLDLSTGMYELSSIESQMGILYTSVINQTIRTIYGGNSRIWWKEGFRNCPQTRQCSSLRVATTRKL